MPDFVSKPAAPERRKREGTHVPGLYKAWQRSHAAAHARSGTRRDPRFTDPDAPFDDVGYEARLAQAQEVAEAAAAQVIARGRPITGTLLRPRHRLSVWWDRDNAFMVPACFDANALYDIHADDYVTLNVAATERYRGKAAAEEARRKTVAAQLNPPSAVEHNGHEVVIP